MPCLTSDLHKDELINRFCLGRWGLQSPEAGSAASHEGGSIGSPVKGKQQSKSQESGEYGPCP